MSKNSIFTVLFCSLYFIHVVVCKKGTGDKPDWAKKNIRDYNDADLERLFDQWEEDEEPLEADELPEHLRKPPSLDFSKVDPKNPESILKMSKKGKTLMTFVTVSGNPSQQQTDDVTKLWQSSLMNNHINVDKYPIGNDRVIFMFKDGSQAWDAKDYLIQQERLELMTIENKEYYGKYSSKATAPSQNAKKEKVEL